MPRFLAGIVLGFLFGALLVRGSDAVAQEHEVCTPELVEDYERREWLIFDLMQEVQECRMRFGGCQPGTHWLEDELERRYREEHPYVPLTEHDLEAWTHEVESDPAVGPE